MTWKYGWLCFAFGLLSGCTHLSLTKDLLSPDFLFGKGSKQVTFFGDNDHPRFSFDGTKLLYTSSRPALHKGVQIYEMDLLSNKERRVTYSDGDAFDGMYISDNEILYASTTDEIKESPLLNKNFNKDFPPSDLYMSDLYGTDIVRLTQQPGMDSEPLLASHETKPFIVFTSRRGDLTGLYRLDLKNLPVSLISAEKDRDKRTPTLSPDHKQLAWIERDLKTQEQSLVLYTFKGKTMKVLKKGEGLYRDLSFAPRSPHRLFYSILRPGEKQYHLEVFDLAQNCTQVLFKGKDSLYSPTVSNDSTERLAFARLFQDKKQIYIVQMPSDLGPCLETLPQATLKE